MKIAICISGQLRDEHLTFPKTASAVASLDATVFVSTWRNRGTKSSGFIGEAQLARMFGDDATLAVPPFIVRYGFNKLFPRFESLVAGSTKQVEKIDIQRFFPNATIEIEDEVLSLDFAAPHRDNNSLRMLYKIWRCNEMKRTYEREQRMTFDVVVRLRPDIVPILSKELIAFIANDDLQQSLWTPAAQAPPRHVGDTIAITDSAGADYYASLFGKAVQDPFRPWNYIHTELYDHLSDAQIKVKDLKIEQWITEDFARAQIRNRAALKNQIDDELFDASALPEDRPFGLLRPLLDIAIVFADEQGGLESAASLVTQHAPSFKAFPREAFGILAHKFKIGGTLDCYILCELMSVISELEEPGIDLSHTSLLYRRIMALYKASFQVKAANVFDLEYVINSRFSGDLSAALSDLRNGFIERKGLSNISGSLDILKNVAQDISFLDIAFIHYLHVDRDLDRARKIAESMIERYPENWLGYDYKGHYCSAAGDFEGAISNARQALVLNPRFAGLNMRLGDLLVSTGQFEDAINCYETAIALASDEIAWFKYLELLIKMNRSAYAAQVIASAIRAHPDSSRIRGIAGQLSNKN